MHPQVKTIGIATVINDSLEVNASQMMRQALAEQFSLDSSLKVKDIEDADCILYGRIKDVRTISSMHDTYNGEQTYIPAEWSLEVKFEFVVLIPGRTEPLIPSRTVVGTTVYQVMGDHDVTRRRGVQQACRDVAERVVTYTTEAW